MIKIMELVIDNNNYDEFLKARFVPGNFLQSSIWQDFFNQKSIRSWRATVLDGQEIVATCLFYEIKLPLDRTYLFAPKGPIISDEVSEDKQTEALELILSKVRDITVVTKKQEEIFFKLELTKFNLVLDRMEKSGDVQPRDTWVLDIDKEPKIILGGMHAKTRYNIALATKKGVKIRFSKEAKDIKLFLGLNKKTASRNQIIVHGEEHYQRLFKVLISNDAGELAIAEIDGTVVAVNILIHFGQATTYLHGASDYGFRKYMAPQLLQWESIKRAREMGNNIYDFGGIAPEDDSKPKWEGLTRFKKSFGGRVITSPGTYDLIYDLSWYKLYNLGAKLKRLLKR
jgi:peptidoglycan pentaglycine glycine transferase (the first glycine)